jgi:hypothetical protein
MADLAKLRTVRRAALSDAAVLAARAEGLRARGLAEARWAEAAREEAEGVQVRVQQGSWRGW